MVTEIQRWIYSGPLVVTGFYESVFWFANGNDTFTNGN